VGSGKRGGATGAKLTSKKCKWRSAWFERGVVGHIAGANTITKTLGGTHPNDTKMPWVTSAKGVKPWVVVGWSARSKTTTPINKVEEKKSRQRGKHQTDIRYPLLDKNVGKRGEWFARNGEGGRDQPPR